MGYAPDSTVAVIGAGPYGVSIAGHLASAGVDFRIFGRPLQRWQSQMPKGMFLKSEGCASNLSEPSGCRTLARYCADNGLPYSARGMPISLEVFTQYAVSFQRSIAPAVEDVMVTEVEKSGSAFRLRLANGATASAGKVIVATGLEHAAHLPPKLTGLPSELLSHSAEHPDLTRFKGKDITVIGGGQSALETAALLHEGGALVRLLVRKPALVWNQTPRVGDQSVYRRLRHPKSNLGDGLELWFCSNLPMLFRHLPQRIRLERAMRVLGPAGAWWLKDRVVGRLQILLHHEVVKAEALGSRAVLHISQPGGRALHLTTDHIIAATGYRFDLSQLPFLSPTLKSQIRTEHQLPVLSSTLEASVPGLYFTGLASVNSFGPAMRFLHGADYTARIISSHIGALRRHASRQSISSFVNIRAR